LYKSYSAAISVGGIFGVAVVVKLQHEEGKISELVTSSLELMSLPGICKLHYTEERKKSAWDQYSGLHGLAAARYCA
jgi:hypothetical protein